MGKRGKRLIIPLLFGKEGKKADNSAIVAINYYGNTAKEDYSFYITSDYLAFQNYYTHFDIWIDDIFSINKEYYEKHTTK